MFFHRHGRIRPEATDKELGGAIKGQSICGMIGAVIGGLPQTRTAERWADLYHQGRGKTGIPDCRRHYAGRRFLSQIQRSDDHHPQPVLGGATVTVFAAITMSGIQLLESSL